MTGAGTLGSEPAGKPPLKPIHLGLTARLRAYFLAGVLITAPVGITVYLSWLFVRFVDSKVTPLIPHRFNPESYLPFAVPGLGLVVVLVVLTVIGMLTAGFLGRTLTHLYEALLTRMPVIRGVYGAVKQVIETVLAQRSQAFRQAVLIEFPRRDAWGVGFITGTPKGELQEVSEEDMVNVFLPTTPNPTTGFLMIVPRKDVVPLQMSVEDAVKLIMSGGIVVPPSLPAEPRPVAPALSPNGSDERRDPAQTGRAAS